ncbi:MAG: carboxypeptidase regulatory-like domain-containing protein [Saprospiraceae bacterium]|nr:carboxypeptidase regulatory-like domain-containing protein [Saprospiraceae bacterium]
MKTRFLQIFLFLLLGLGVQAQVTTSSISGKVFDKDGVELIGATVIALHVPSGSEYGVITRIDGKYNINNMNPGGPYVIKVNYLGYAESKAENVYLNLGESSKFDFNLSEESNLMNEILVTGSRSFNANRTGSETVIGSEK